MFSQVAFQFPPTLEAVADSVQTALAGAGAELGAAQGRLSAAPDYSTTNNPVAGAATGSIGEHGHVVDGMLVGVSVACVHPWVQGIGEGDGHYRYLSRANAVKAAAEKLTDQHDYASPSGTIDVLVVLISADGFFGFSEALKQFNSVFPLPQTMLCARRAGQIASVEADKIVLPTAAMNARWVGHSLGDYHGITSAAGAVGEYSAHAEAYELGAVDPTQELNDLIAKKASLIAESQSALLVVQAAFNGGEGVAKFIGNKTPAQAKALLEASGAGHDAPLCCCVVFTSPPGELELLRELMGL
jgi:hypothetical protein